MGLLMIIIYFPTADQDGTDESRHGEEHRGEVEDCTDNGDHNGHYQVVIGHKVRRVGLHYTWLIVGWSRLLEIGRQRKLHSTWSLAVLVGSSCCVSYLCLRLSMQVVLPVLIVHIMSIIRRWGDWWMNLALRFI